MPLCQLADAYGVEDKQLYYLEKSFVKDAAMQTEKNVHTVIVLWNNASLEDRTAYVMPVMENKSDCERDVDFHEHLQVIVQFVKMLMYYRLHASKLVI